MKLQLEVTTFKVEILYNLLEKQTFEMEWIPYPRFWLEVITVKSQNHFLFNSFIHQTPLKDFTLIESGMDSIF